MDRIYLCEICSTIPFHSNDPREASWVLGRLADLRNRHMCALCQLARFVVETDRDIYASTDLVTFIRQMGIRDGVTGLQSTRYPVVYSISGRGHADLMFLREVHEQHSENKVIIPVTRPTLDLGRAKGWLEYCVSAHDKCQRLSTDSMTFKAGHLRLINVVTGCVELLELPQRYIALSYVWGGAPTFRLTSHNMHSLSQRGALKKIWTKIPRTIRDAMDVVRGLGEQYLWVDALCLVQNDAEDMRGGIEVMDLIYECAVVTIIAASGSHANAGLPGAGSTPRNIMQRIVEVQPGLRIACHFDVEHFLKGSAHNQRGWTFQETVLSRRALIFVNDQMYFRCRRARFSEDTVDPPSVVVHGLSSSSSLLPHCVQLDVTMMDWEHMLMYYSERTFSNQADVQLAMTGIIRRVSKKMRCRFFQGIPTAAFDAFIPFNKTTSILRRRRGFPSYTWAGWIGRIETNFEDGTIGNVWLRNHTWIVWYKRSPSGVLNPVWDRMANEKFPFLDEEALGYRERSSFGARFDVPSSRTTPTEDFSFTRNPPPYPMLQFWTLVMTFEISDFNVFYGTAFILDHHGIKCGAVDMDGFEDDEFFRPGGRYDFMLLSDVVGEDRHICAYNDVHTSEMEAYRVLLLEWTGGIAERRGIGVLCRLALARALSPGPSWKEILLA